MPSRRQFQNKLSEAERRKRRQEKFRKRTPSLFRKAKQLAKDTDAWVFLVVGDRTGQVNSFRSSNSFYWPPSIKDLIKKHPSGNHEFIEKHATSDRWKEVAEDESDSALVDVDTALVDNHTDLFVEDVWARRMTTIEMEVGSDSTIMANQCHVGKEVEVCANAPKDQTTKGVERQKSREPECTSVIELRGSEGTTVDVHGESDHTNIDALRESDDPSADSLGEQYNVNLDSDSEPDSMVVNLGESDNMTIGEAGEPNNAIPDAPAESGNPTVYVLRDSDNVIDVLESIALGVLDTTGVDPTTSEYNIMDLDIPEARKIVEMEAREGKSIESANMIYTISQDHGTRTSGGLSSREVVNSPRTMRQDSQQGRGSKVSTGIDLKELLKGWNWVFQRE